MRRLPVGGIANPDAEIGGGGREMLNSTAEIAVMVGTAREVSERHSRGLQKNLLTGPDLTSKG